MLWSCLFLGLGTGCFPQSCLSVWMTTWQLQLAPALHVEFTRCSLHMNMPYSSADCTTTPHKEDGPSLVYFLSQMNPTYKLVSCISNNHLHFTLLSTSRSAKWSFPLEISDYNRVSVYQFSQTCHFPHPPYPSSSEYLNPYPTAFPYGNGMVLHFYQQQESSTTKTVHKVIHKGLKAYV